MFPLIYWEKKSITIMTRTYRRPHQNIIYTCHVHAMQCTPAVPTYREKKEKLQLCLANSELNANETICIKRI